MGPMKLTVVHAECTGFQTPLLVVNLFQGADALTGVAAEVDAALGGRISELRARGEFRGKVGDTLLLYPAAGASGAERVLLVGVGEDGELTAERIRRAAGAASKAAMRCRTPRIAAILPRVDGAKMRVGAAEAARAQAEGFVLGAYTFSECRSVPEDGEPPTTLEEVYLLAAPDEEPSEAVREAVRVGGILARAECLARDLGNRPGNVVTPGYLAEVAERIGGEYGMKVTVLGRDALREEGMGALLAVAQGSEQEPRLIVLEHRRGASGGRPLALVGKGVTFDSGGISIKPAASMEEMKFDMSGAGAVLGAMQAIGELDVEANVVAIIPATENLLSGASFKPGDIVRSHLGKTVEIVNTDAEGRLILADALSYLRRFEPAAAVDVATLTGACVIALGDQASAVMGNDAELIAELRAAGERTGERTWELPMYDEFSKQIRSDFADIKNSGGRPAGTITAGWFLREFVGDFPWAHLDIAGVAYGEGKLPYQVKGSTGAPTRLLADWILARAG